jgi:hypothetical protein
MPTTQPDKVLTEERVEQARKSGQLTARRERLICCGVVGQYWDRLTPTQKKAIKASERAAEGGAVAPGRAWDRLTRLALKAEANLKPRQLLGVCVVPNSEYTLLHLAYDVVAATEPCRAEQENILRGPAGLFAMMARPQNPCLVAVFEDVCPQPDVRTLLPAPDALRAWHEGTVVRLAQAIYHERAWDGMPILGDALDEARCTSPEVLAHCRSGGIHVRACWLLDWLLDLR